MFDIKIKYNTRAADYYIRMNNAKAIDLQFSEDEPSYEEGRTLLDGRKLDKDGNITEAQTPDESGAGLSADGISAEINEISEEVKQ